MMLKIQLWYHRKNVHFKSY